jgi:hypothetical protein
VNEDKIKIAEEMVRECFWGDYHTTPEWILEKIEANDEKFKIFLISKMIDNARHPSKFLRILFKPEDLQALLYRVSVLPGSRREKRLRLIRANVLDIKDNINEWLWIK